MNASTPCDRLWRKRLDALSAVWPELLGGRNTGLHRTRVASRRIREALPIIAVGARPAKVKKLNRKMRKLTRYLGPIRELDVKLDMLDAASRNGRASGRALELIRREVASQRQALRHELRDSLPVSDIRKLIKKLERIAHNDRPRAKSSRKFNAEWRSVLATRTLRRTKDLGKAVEAAGPIYVPERVHEVRIAIKKLRYVLEIVQDVRVPGAAAAVRTLKRQQERLGRLHDLQALLRQVHETGTLPVIGSRVNDLNAYAEALDRECRRLHADFVEHRAELLNCVKGVRLHVVPALTASANHQIKVTAVRRPATAARVRAR